MSEKTQIIITAKDETQAAIRSVNSSLQGLSKTAIGLGPVFAGLTGLLSFAAFKGAIEGSIKFAAALDDMAESTGASVENLSALSKVAKVGGTDLASVETGLQKLAKALHSTDEETKGAGKALAALGLNIDALAEKDTAAALFDVAKAMAQFEDGSAKTAVAIAILGKSGAQLLPFLKDLAEESELIGRVTAEQAAQAEAYEKNLNRLSGTMSAFARAAAMEVLPFLESLTSEMVKAKDESTSFASVFGSGIKTAFETVAVLGLNVAYVFKQVGNELGGLAAQAAAVARLDFAGARNIGIMMKEDAAKARADIDAASEKILNPLKADATVTKKLKLDFTSSEAKPKAARAAGGGRAQIDEAERLIKSLDEQIALKQAAGDAEEKLTSAELNAIKVRYQLAAGTLKATEAQKASINADLDKLVALEKASIAQKEWTEGVKRQEEANVKSRQAMLDHIAATEEQANLYGLNESAINAVWIARLADAQAMAAEAGATEDLLQPIKDEIELREKLGDALEKNDLQRLISGTEAAQAKKKAADLAVLDRALAKGPENGGIDEKTYKEARAKLEQVESDLDEFGKKAAQSMQSAFADFLFDPFAQGTKTMLQQFVDMIRRMVAEALAANILKALFGDMGKTGQVTGLIGSAISAFGFEDGGIMTSAGPVPLRKYAGGGIARTPQMALFGEGSTPEAYVPVPSGKIPVEMRGAATPPPAQNIRIVNAFDTSVIGDYLGSAAGERIILNAVQRNAGAMRQALA